MKFILPAAFRAFWEILLFQFQFKYNCLNCTMFSVKLVFTCHFSLICNFIMTWLLYFTRGMWSGKYLRILWCDYFSKYQTKLWYDSHTFHYNSYNTTNVYVFEWNLIRIYKIHKTSMWPTRLYWTFNIISLMWHTIYVVARARIFLLDERALGGSWTWICVAIKLLSIRVTTFTPVTTRLLQVAHYLI